MRTEIKKRTNIQKLETEKIIMGNCTGYCISDAGPDAKRKITVNCVAPGLIDTGMVDEHVKEHAMPQIPLRRMGEPEEVAGLVSYLMSDIAGYVTRKVPHPSFHSSAKAWCCSLG